jgi:hypothetical protein
MRNLLTILLLVVSTMVFAQPANDNCGGATSITPDGTCQNGTNVSANDNWAGEVGCATVGGPNAHLDVWYSFVATGTNVDIVVTDISVGGTIEVILVEPATLPCTGPFTVLVTSCAVGGTTASYGSLVVGNTYYYTISANGSNTGTFQHCTTTQTPVGAGNQDCVNATAICNNNTFSGNSSGNGVQELTAANQGCMTTEHQSSWYTFTIQTSGTLSMTISPQNGTDDYDFALWGPNPNCPPTSAPVRCSWAAGGGNTGLVNGAGDNTEGVLGDKWVEDGNVTAGQTFVLLIDNFSSSGSAFDLTWGGTATLDCAVLPIELVSFDCEWSGNNVNLNWVSASEINNDYFLIEYSTDGFNWVMVNKVEGAGNSSSLLEYTTTHYNVSSGNHYYRLTQVDFDGKHETFNIISCEKHINKEHIEIIEYYNTTGQLLFSTTDPNVVYEYNGLVLIKTTYKNGSINVEKTYKICCQ